MSDKYFGELVGLVNTKRRLSFYIDNFHSSGLMPNLLLNSAKGNGKTSVARLIAKGMNRKLVEVNCAELESLDDFFGVISQYCKGNAVLFMDESENLSKEISIALLTILNPTKENYTEYSHNGQKYSFNFKNFSVIMASTELQTIHHALVDRLRVIDFDIIKNEDLKQIIKNNLKEYRIEDGLLDRIVTIVRSNPRQAQILCNDLLTFLGRRGTKEFSTKIWFEFFSEMGLFELGFTNSEIRLLKILKQYPNSSLTRVASMLNQTVESTRKATELYPLRTGLLEIKAGSGRKLSPSGYEFVDKLEREALTSQIF